MLQLPSWSSVLAALQDSAANSQAALHVNYYAGQFQAEAVQFVPPQTFFSDKEKFDDIQCVLNEGGQQNSLRDNFESLSNHNSAIHEQSDSTAQKRIRHRRTFKELSREIYCPIENCKRKYASRSSLSTHLRLKHSKEAQRQQMEEEAKKKRDSNRVPKPLMPKAPMCTAGFSGCDAQVVVPANITSLPFRTANLANVTNSHLPLRSEESTNPSKIAAVPSTIAKRRISLENLFLQPTKNLPPVERESTEGGIESEHQSSTPSSGPVTPLSVSGAALPCSKGWDGNMPQWQNEGAANDFLTNFVAKGFLENGMDMLISTFGEAQNSQNDTWPSWPLTQSSYMSAAIAAGAGTSIPRTVDFKDERTALVK